MNENIKNTLIDFGLTPEEVKVYLAMLINDQTTILKIAEEARIKRSTVYLIMASLINKKIVRVSTVGKRKFYFAENPKILLEETERQRQALEDVMPLLKEQYKIHKERPRVTLYEGREGVEKVYEEIANLKPRKEILWYGNQQELEEEFLDALQKIDDRLVNLTDFEGSRILFNDSKVDRGYGIKYMTDKRYNYPMSVRVLPKGMKFIHIDNCVYENKVAIFSIKKDFFVIVIESNEIANIFRTMFDLAWKNAVKIKF